MAVVSISAAHQFGASVSHFLCYNAAMAMFTTSYCLWQIKKATGMYSERCTDHDLPEGNLLHMLLLTLRKPALFGDRWSLVQLCLNCNSKRRVKTCTFLCLKGILIDLKFVIMWF